MPVFRSQWACGEVGDNCLFGDCVGNSTMEEVCVCWDGFQNDHFAFSYRDCGMPWIAPYIFYIICAIPGFIGIVLSTQSIFTNTRSGKLSVGSTRRIYFLLTVVAHAVGVLSFLLAHWLNGVRLGPAAVAMNIISFVITFSSAIAVLIAFSVLLVRITRDRNGKPPTTIALLPIAFTVTLSVLVVVAAATGHKPENLNTPNSYKHDDINETARYKFNLFIGLGFLSNVFNSVTLALWCQKLMFTIEKFFSDTVDFMEIATVPSSSNANIKTNYGSVSMDKSTQSSKYGETENEELNVQPDDNLQDHEANLESTRITPSGRFSTTTNRYNVATLGRKGIEDDDDASEVDPQFLELAYLRKFIDRVQFFRFYFRILNVCTCVGQLSIVLIHFLYGFPMFWIIYLLYWFILSILWIPLYRMVKAVRTREIVANSRKIREAVQQREELETHRVSEDSINPMYSP